MSETASLKQLRGAVLTSVISERRAVREATDKGSCSKHHALVSSRSSPWEDSCTARIPVYVHPGDER